MPDDFFEKIPKFCKINFRTAKAHWCQTYVFKAERKKIAIIFPKGLAAKIYLLWFIASIIYFRDLLIMNKQSELEFVCHSKSLEI